MTAYGFIEKGFLKGSNRSTAMAMLVFLSGHPCMAEVGALHNIQLMPEHDALSGEFQVGEVSQKWSQIIVELEGSNSMCCGCVPSLTDSPSGLREGRSMKCRMQ